jgi:hypothetical protein
MVQRWWWAAAGAGVAVVALVGVVAVMSAGSPGSGGDPAGGGDAGGAASTGGGSSGDAGTADSPPATTRPPQPRPRPSAVAPRAQAPRADLPLALAIQSYEQVAPDRLQVRYATGLPECYGALDRAYVSESGDRVLVTLRVRPVAQPPSQPCPDIAMVEDTLVRLDQPLGDRAVVDGTSGQAVRRGHFPTPG